MTKIQLERSVLIFLIVIAVFLFWSTASFRGIAIATSGKYVKFISGSIGILCLLQMIITFGSQHSSERFEFVENKAHFYTLLISLVCYAIAFPYLGFFLATAIFIPILTYCLGYRSWKILALVPAGFILFVHLIFVKLLSVNLPGFGF